MSEILPFVAILDESEKECSRCSDNLSDSKSRFKCAEDYSIFTKLNALLFKNFVSFEDVKCYNINHFQLHQNHRHQKRKSINIFHIYTLTEYLNSSYFKTLNSERTNVCHLNILTLTSITA